MLAPAMRRGILLLFASIACAFALRSAPADDTPPVADDAAKISGFQFLKDDRVRRNIDLANVRKGVPRPDPRDGIPSIKEPVTVKAAEADFLLDDDPVIGLTVGGASRAYATRILDHHEVVNDELGGLPVAMTYCPLCDSGVAFRRDYDYDPTRTDEPPLIFGISGYLNDSDVLLYDHQTETFWQQLTAVGVIGPLTNAILAQFPVVRTTWKAWREAHPDTTALSWKTEYKYPKELYSGLDYREYRVSKQLMFFVHIQDVRLPRKAIVYGVSAGQEHVAIPWAEVADRKDPFEIDLGGRRFRATVDPKAETMRVEVRKDAKAGEPEAWAEVPALRCYWFAWYAFHPKTSLWTATGPPAPK